MKRHQSLIPLSHDHHLGLILAQRVKKGHSRAPKSEWPEKRDLQRDRTVEFFDTEWTHHLQAEEQFLFPLAEKHLSTGSEILAVLRKQHGQLRDLVEKLRTARAGQLENLLLRFAHVLEENIRKEERIFFGRLQLDVPEDRLIECGKQIENFFKQVQKTGSDRCLL